MNTLVTEFTLSDVQKIAAVTDEAVQFSIIAILSLLTVKDQIAILQMSAIVRIIAIDIIAKRESGYFRNYGPQIFKLLKKRSTEIEWSSVG